jgi:hypothetical protein
MSTLDRLIAPCAATLQLVRQAEHRAEVLDPCHHGSGDIRRPVAEQQRP